MVYGFTMLKMINFASRLAFLSALLLVAPITSLAAEAPVTACDRLASDKNDPQRVAEPVELSKQNLDAAHEACRRAYQAHPNSLRLQHLYARTLTGRKDPAAMDLLQGAAGQGYAAAQELLASVYSTGFLGKKDKTKAYDLYAKAAVQGLHESQFEQAAMLIEGTGISKDVEKALTLLEQYAEAGNPLAYSFLATLYREGKQVEQDYDLAFRYAQKGTDLGSARAKQILAFLFVEGKGAPEDFNKGMALLRQNAKTGYQPSQFSIGYFYLSELLPSDDFDRDARFWLCKSRESGYRAYKGFTGRDLTCPKSTTP